MKRLASIILGIILLAAVMITGVIAATSGGFQLAAGTDSFTLSADKAYTTPITCDQPERIEDLQALLARAGSLTIKQPNATELARIRTLAGDTPRSYVLYRYGDSYYLERGGQWRTISYTDFDAFVKKVDSDAEFFPYCETPYAISTVEQHRYRWPVLSGNYQYRRLDGGFAGGTATADTTPVTVKTRATTISSPTFSEQPQEVSYSIYRHSDGEKLWSGNAIQLANYRLNEDIVYEIRAHAQYRSAYYRGDVAYSLLLDRSPRIQFHIRGGDTYLGEAVVLEITGTDSSDPLATFTSNISLNLPSHFHRRADGSQVALFPVSYRNAAGNYWIEVRCGEEAARFTISAQDKQWQIQNLTVSSSTAAETIESQQANNEYERVIAPLRPVEDDVQYWSGRFILPVSDQKVTTQFGMVRYVNGQPTSTRHGALDLAVPRGTAVAAAGSGRVLYAGYLQLTGNTVLIEHGYGLKSWYYHMDSLNVQTGTLVEQGQKIGEVGSTGFSTGPHLHFGMSVNNVFINPYTAINTDLFA